jgi:hypothetical protein
MVFSYDSPQPAEERQCDSCGRPYLLLRAFIVRDGDPYAIIFAACHVHDGDHEAWIDVILGTFSSDDHSDHVTFGARIGPVAGQDEPAATAVPAAAAYSNSAFWGIKLSRDEALSHPRIGEFWEVVDYLLLTASRNEQPDRLLALTSEWPRLTVGGGAAIAFRRPRPPSCNPSNPTSASTGGDVSFAGPSRPRVTVGSEVADLT